MLQLLNQLFKIGLQKKLPYCNSNSTNLHYFRRVWLVESKCNAVFILPYIHWAGIMELFSLCKFRKHHKRYLYNFYPLKPHFYIVKLGLTRVYIIFLISAQNIDCGYSLEAGSNEYPQSMFWTGIYKISEFVIWNFPFLVLKFSIYLNRRVFVMYAILTRTFNVNMTIYEKWIETFYRRANAVYTSTKSIKTKFISIFYFL